MLNYQRFFDFAPNGAFQMSTSGVLLMINESFATSLGYDSVGAVFTDKANILDFMPSSAEGLELLRLLRDIPGMRHEALLSLSGGGVKAFWIMSIAGAHKEERPELSCFLIERSTDVLLAHCHREYADVLDKHDSVALFLATTARYFQHYIVGERRAKSLSLTASERRGSGEGKDNISPAAPVPNILTPLLNETDKQTERRQSAFLLKTVFDDIYQIAIDEAELESISIAPVNMHLLLEQLYSQAFPETSAREITLHTSIEAEHKQRFSCSASLLRHAFLRSLMVVTQNAHGGNAHVKITKIDAGGQAEDIFILRSVISWESASVEAATLGKAGIEATDHSSPLPNDLGLSTQKASIQDIERAIFSRADELKVINFLVDKLGGTLIPGVLKDNSRSLQMDLFFQQVDEFNARLCVQGHYCTGFRNADGEYADEIVQGASFDPSSVLATEEEAEKSNAVSMAALDLISTDDLLDDNAIASSDASTERGLDILIVEDSLNSRLLFSRFLRGTNHLITEAENGLIGVELVRKRSFDVIFMDMEMPLLDGYQATRIIRALEADEHRQATPIIAQTAHVLPEYKQKCLRVGCSEVLSKPFSKSALLAILNALVQNKQESA